MPFWAKKESRFSQNSEKRQKKGDTAGKGGLPEAAVEVSRGKNRRFGDAFLSPHLYYSKPQTALQEKIHILTKKQNMNKLKTRGKKAGAGRVKRQKNAVFHKTAKNGKRKAIPREKEDCRKRLWKSVGGKTGDSATPFFHLALIIAEVPAFCKR